LMALVIIFVPDPPKGVAEMVRVVGPGGLVATYVWDMLDGGLPTAPLLGEMRALGLPVPEPPRNEASRLEALRNMWTGAALEAVES
ncbi:MAG TPA: SAM-dependent methyltransferase, partial [Salinarimonas sp.]|nr:SAM-dependent methyltransferase [Salinarimonas sp.]